MNFFLDKQHLKSLLAGLLATVIFAAPLTGCQNKTSSKMLLSHIESSSVGSQQSSQTDSPKVENKSSLAANAKVSSSSNSQTSSQKKSSSQKSSSTVTVKSAQNVQTNPAVTKVAIGNKAIKKIAVDQSTKTNTRLSVTKSTAVTAGYSHIDQRSGYNYLSDSISRNVYNQILQSVYKVTVTPNSQGYYPTEQITVNAHLTEAQLRIVLLAFLNDNPQIFWLANVYSYGYSDNATYIQFYSYISQNECNTMVQQLNAKINTLTQSMPSGLTEFDRELYLFNYLTQNCVYDTQAVTDSSRWKSFTSYGAITEGKVVCEGYAKAMQLISSYCGIQCMQVTGQCDGVNHMWNLMKIDGNWYHLDITWCDNNPTIYNYFNVTSSVIAQTRSINPIASSLTESQIDDSAGCNLYIPACTATQANYFKVKGIPITDVGNSSDSTVTNAIASALKQKNESISFYAEVDASNDKVLNKIVSCLGAAVNESGVAISNIKYIVDQPNHGITVFLSYK